MIDVLRGRQEQEYDHLTDKMPRLQRIGVHRKGQPFVSWRVSKHMPHLENQRNGAIPRLLGVFDKG
jgi:hypothetical protein